MEVEWGAITVEGGSGTVVTCGKGLGSITAEGERETIVFVCTEGSGIEVLALEDENEEG